ncbi:hypothetical protein RZS08_24830, partial [Arthrospira platensis SPKY1]|nr:hypothetical protein [Arthrospira platensis SPKY1]
MRSLFSVLRVLLIPVLIGVSAPSQAIGLVIAGDEMKAMMQPFLPYRLAFGEWKIQLTDPEPAFQPKGQRVALGFRMQLEKTALPVAEETLARLQAQARIGGELFYDKTRGQLQLVQPTLMDFVVQEGDASTFAPLITQLKQNLG